MADVHAKHHDYHLVDPSPWPLIGAIGAFIMAVGGIGLMRWNNGDDLSVIGINVAGPWVFILGLLVVLFTMFNWWRDTIRESLAGFHTRVVSLHLRYGMILFITSEVMFFVAWFWAYFDASLYPSSPEQVLRSEFTGGQWPPMGVETFDPWHLPLFNTLVLLLSGTTVTWAHHALLEGDRRGLKLGLAFTVALGVLFSTVQIIEYSHATFTFGGSIYGATFFMATGFHGFHVFIGTVFLAVCLIRALYGQLTPQKHFGLEAAAWYWHFVDVVWLFLFAAIYVFGASEITA